MANDTKPMQPDAKPATIAIKTLRLPPGIAVEWPGPAKVSSSITATSPCVGQFWTINYDPRLRHHVVSYYAPGEDPKRPPVGVVLVHESQVLVVVPA